LSDGFSLVFGRLRPKTSETVLSLARLLTPQRAFCACGSKEELFISCIFAAQPQKCMKKETFLSFVLAAQPPKRTKKKALFTLPQPALSLSNGAKKPAMRLASTSTA
jgi:hypothetical protein